MDFILYNIPGYDGHGAYPAQSKIECRGWTYDSLDDAIRDSVWQETARSSCCLQEEACILAALLQAEGTPFRRWLVQHSLIHEPLHARVQ